MPHLKSYPIVYQKNEKSKDLEQEKIVGAGERGISLPCARFFVVWVRGGGG
jgi:hypothetical protein